ncbi:hypothetical protein COU76_04100 [Candidatus Peregrinibacteria bacterium CG10_big_fil_rev_8_21_14_0_10_49_10]|nr:MAG: hypothetical protein COU76_04100 [Candidatus Peregrinibacteria bacterium CG10_big_fil_rev_8_21_14_0_10_49_10]
MSNAFSLIGTAWDFKKSQPVFRAVLFWLLFLPMLCLFVLSDYIANEPYFSSATWEDVATGTVNPHLLIGTLFLQILIVVLLLWGIASVTLVGKRLVQSRAGRARTSFKTVRRQAAHLVTNLFLTSILRGCITLLWSLLLVVPGIVYSVRTFFYFVAILCEGKGYREALNQSSKVVRGQTWVALKQICGLCAVIFFPLIVIDSLIVQLVYLLAPALLRITYLSSSYLISLGLLLFLLSSMTLYAELQSSSS